MSVAVLLLPLLLLLLLAQPELRMEPFMASYRP
jgi:hypothetical protein